MEILLEYSFYVDEIYVTVVSPKIFLLSETASYLRRRSKSSSTNIKARPAESTKPWRYF